MMLNLTTEKADRRIEHYAAEMWEARRQAAEYPELYRVWADLPEPQRMYLRAMAVAVCEAVERDLAADLKSALLDLQEPAL